MSNITTTNDNIEISGDSAIEFRHVTKEYKLYKNDKQRFRAIFSKHVKCKVRKAVNDVDFTIRKGEAVALFGRNGAGKSTLLKMITGVTYPTKGDIVVDGRVSALLELTAGFDPEFTGRENIYFRGQLMGMKNDEIAKLEPAIVDFAELGDYMDQPVRTYSSGMKARLGFAINVNIEPEILIVDEALSVGDVSFKNKCTEKINDLVNNYNITFLFVTHSTKVAAEFCHRGIVLKKGAIVFDGTIDESIAYYKDMVKTEDEEKRRKKQAAKEVRLF
ncbi:ABC transporter ATP-binding protein [Aminicella lysinilytica]|uniref:Teichoic acid transport system ATP-binding protein n=1 Tax=Aminicella lysinilytica TaxID=433323 RepID=A0A4R6PWZ2_9FIRM|nr:ABC transporter ATP-binding protein [Aminicella lysinilytica]TDP48318.1 teichoic acid transport system ATP-binding protein [Aminicella lysinilytica]